MGVTYRGSPSRNPLKSGQGFNIFDNNRRLKYAVWMVVIPLNRVKVSTTGSSIREMWFLSRNPLKSGQGFNLEEGIKKLGESMGS